MKESVQAKVQQILSLANNSTIVSDNPVSYPSRPSNDSLSQAIRNPQEAEIFMAELHAVMQLAQKNK